MVAFFLAGALLAALAWVERRRRAQFADLRAAGATIDKLRDDVWRLEAAAAARDRAEAASEAKSRFLAIVSHEIRTPLAGILGLADLLKGLPLEAEAATYVSAIRTSGAALATLIDEILDFSRIEAGRLELADVVFELAPLLDGVVELLSPRAQGKGIAVALLLDPACPRALRGDPARLRQILLNLAGNAIKFTDRGGVGLRVSPVSGGGLRVAVEDTGCGVPLDRQAAIFEEFEQAREGADQGGGAGLGLAISRSLAQRMGGALALERSGPEGSVFVLTVPARAGMENERGAARAAQPPQRVLLASSSAFEAPYLAQRLRWLGCVVTLVADDAEAARALAEARFDVAVVDRALGEEEARRLAALAHERGASRALVLLSPYERRSLAPLTWRAFDGWLVKPVRDASLRRWLEDDGPRTRPTSPAPRPAMRLAGRRVLLAEDDDVNALVATRRLEREGARVTRVGDGAAALDALEGGGFDAALMDLRMPRCDGLRAARLLREGQASAGAARLPLVALSANAGEEDRRAAAAAGFDLFFTKPADFDRLVADLAEAIARASRKARRDALAG